MKRKTFLLLISFLMLLMAFNGFQEEVFEVPPNWPKPIYNFAGNPLTPQKAELGRALFYDPILSANLTISCASCHAPQNAFTHADHALSHGIYDSIGTRNSPALMNLAWHSNFMWDGAINHLDVQALAPINHQGEMGETTANVVKKLNERTLYPPLFYAAWGDSLVTGERMLKSLSQFMLSLVSANAKYDLVIRKQEQFSPQEQKGYQLYKTHCSGCHPEPLFTNLQFENNGLCSDPNLNDLGRFRVSKLPQDSFCFKVPTLRNIEFTFPYMHDGRFTTLGEVIDHYSSPNCKRKNFTQNAIKPLHLNSHQRVELISFLLTLTDQKFLFNKKFSYPMSVFFPEKRN